MYNPRLWYVCVHLCSVYPWITSVTNGEPQKTYITVKPFKCRNRLKKKRLSQHEWSHKWSGGTIHVIIFGPLMHRHKWSYPCGPFMTNINGPPCRNGRKTTSEKNAWSQSNFLTSPYSFLNSYSWLASYNIATVGWYCIVKILMRKNINWWMEHAWSFDQQNYDESIIDYIGETLGERKFSRENFDESPNFHQIYQTFPLSTICTS